jgi:hypothetical protein
MLRPGKSLLLPVNEEVPMATAPEKTTVPPNETVGDNAPEGIAPSEVVEQTTSPDEAATESGVDSSAGDSGDATTTPAPGVPPVADVEPDIRGAAMNAQQAVRDYAATKRA